MQHLASPTRDFRIERTLPLLHGPIHLRIAEHPRKPRVGVEFAPSAEIDAANHKPPKHFPLVRSQRNVLETAQNLLLDVPRTEKARIGLEEDHGISDGLLVPLGEKAELSLQPAREGQPIVFAVELRAGSGVLWSTRCFAKPPLELAYLGGIL